MNSNTAAVETPPHSNILQFPSSRSVSSQDPQQIASNVLSMKVVSVEDAIGFIIPIYFESLLSAGFRIDDDLLNDMFVGMTRAVMYRHFGVDHPLIDFIEKHADELGEILANQIPLCDE